MKDCLSHRDIASLDQGYADAARDECSMKKADSLICSLPITPYTLL